MNSKNKKLDLGFRAAISLVGFAMLSEAVVWADSIPQDAEMASEVRLQGEQAMNEMAVMGNANRYWMAQLESLLNEHLVEYRRSQLRFASNEDCPCDETDFKTQGVMQ